MDIQQILNLGVGAFGMFLMYKLYDKTLSKLSNSIDTNTSATKELYDYIKVRNGTLERLVKTNSIVKKAAKETLEG